ncbi:hypothetical protein E6C70_09680 [Glaciibacter flavus]|uniref:Uncharacterized protein n=1 Tax=Orlajensenia flava TaxID=2565934 RepID=A0A4S4FX22_9MICO|nr:hypothetical protein [Glaciibacter flavus]THG34515.1 hypothetical protein E6C70_09680 [Glaciibacter flavus]
MKLLRHPPLFWILLAALIASIVVMIANLIFDWQLKWLMLVALLIVFGANIYTFRRMWVHSDHPAFHAKARPEED